MRGPLNGTGDELWKKHDVESVHAEMPLRLLAPVIYFKGIAQRLEGMKRKSDRQKNIQMRKDRLPAAQMDQRGQRLGRKIEVFKKAEHSQIGRATQGQPHFPTRTI